MIGGIGVVAIAVRWAGVTVGARSLVLAHIRVWQAALGAVAPRKLLAEEALQLAKAATGTASLGASTASRRGDTSSGWPSAVCVVELLGRVLQAQRRAGAGARSHAVQARGELRED